MASTYSTNLAIELIGTGDQAGSWGNTTNTNLGTLIEQAISGYVTQAVSTGTDTTITIPNGATGVARNMYIELTGTGGASTNLIVPANKKLYFIFNNTSSGQVTVKVSGQTGVSVPNGKKMVLVSNGTDVVVAENYIADFGSNSATITNLTCTSLTLSNNPTFSGGTADGVLYLNGSKVATSGSALTFDGTNLTASRGLKAASAGVAVSSFVDGLSVGGYDSIGFLASPGNALAIGGYRTSQWSGLEFYTSGSLQATLTSTGLGIGTASPTDTNNFGRALDIRSSTGAAAYFRDSDDATKYAVAGFFGADSNAYYGSWGTGTGVLFYSAGSERMRLDSSGNLGIGTSSPSGFLANKLVIATGGTANEGMTIYSSSNNGSIWFADATTGTGRYAGGLDYTHSDDTLIFYSAAQGNMRLNASGNLGLGVTPSAYGTRGFDIAGFVGLSQNSAGAAVFAFNNFQNGAGNYIYKTTNPAARYDCGLAGTAAHAWYIAASGTAGNAISFTQAMTLDASGRLLVGTTSSYLSQFKSVVEGATSGSATLALGLYKGGTPQILNGDVLGNLYFYGIDNDLSAGNDNLGGRIHVEATSDWTSTTTCNAAMVFSTHGNTSGAPTERARITSGGDLLLGTTDANVNSGTGIKLLPNGSKIAAVTANTTNATATFSTYSTGAAAFRFYVADDGTIYATSTSITAISDQSLKENVRDLDTGLSEVMALKPRRFDWKNGDAKDVAGFVAQEVESVLPELVYDYNYNAKEIKKGLKMGDMLPTLVKAIQEQQAMIKSLEAKVAALESK